MSNVAITPSDCIANIAAHIRREIRLLAEITPADYLA